jgi:hypothetical protein
LRYVDKLGQPQTLQFTVSLISNLQNGSASEDIEHIRRVAPSTYYTQNRMVNGADYNLFPLKDPSILKLRTINRTYAGESKYSRWHDASETYENVKLAGDDMIVMFQDYTNSIIVSEAVTTDVLFANTIVPILSTTGSYTRAFLDHVGNIRRSFTADETLQITTVLLNNVWPDPVYIVYDKRTDVFSATTSQPVSYWIAVNATMNGGIVVGWVVYSLSTKMVTESPTTRFWTANSTAIVAEDTITAERDKVMLIKANSNKYDNPALLYPGSDDRTRLLTAPITLSPSGVVYDMLDGLQNINQLEVIAYDATQAALSGTSLVSQLIDPEYTFEVNAEVDLPLRIELPFSYVVGMKEVSIDMMLPSAWQEDSYTPPGSLSSVIELNEVPPYYSVTVIHNSFVYHTRTSALSPWVYSEPLDTVRTQQALEELSDAPARERKYRRLRGRAGLNFMWLHQTQMFHLVDPSPTNINDAFVIQKGYYNNVQSWLRGTGDKPLAPTPLQLRNDYKALLDNAMISDTVVFHSGKLKLIMGNKAIPQLQSKLLVVKNPRSQLTDSQIKLKVRDVVRGFFDITYWEFGETFYFTELSAMVHKELASDINSIVLVPLYPDHFFGDMFQVNMSEDEIIQVDIDIEDVEVATALNSVNTNQVR